MAIPFRSCCFIFSLRQGTMLIAVIELLLSAIALFLLLLGSAHVQEMAAMLQNDIEESEQREGIYFSSNEIDRPFHISNNEIRLLKAQHLALVMIIGIYTSIAMVTIHLITCVLLLYGSVMHIRQFFLPWMILVMLALAFSFTAFLVAWILGWGSFAILFITSLCLEIRTSLWLVVFSLYRQLDEEQAASCAALVQQDMTTIKAHYLNFPPNYKPSQV